MGGKKRGGKRKKYKEDVAVTSCTTAETSEVCSVKKTKQQKNVEGEIKEKQGSSLDLRTTRTVPVFGKAAKSTTVLETNPCTESTDVGNTAEYGPCVLETPCSYQSLSPSSQCSMKNSTEPDKSISTQCVVMPQSADNTLESVDNSRKEDLSKSASSCSSQKGISQNCKSEENASSFNVNKQNRKAEENISPCNVSDLHKTMSKPEETSVQPKNVDGSDEGMLQKNKTADEQTVENIDAHSCKVAVVCPDKSHVEHSCIPERVSTACSQEIEREKSCRIIDQKESNHTNTDTTEEILTPKDNGKDNSLLPGQTTDKQADVGTLSTCPSQSDVLCSEITDSQLYQLDQNMQQEEDTTPTEILPKGGPGGISKRGKIINDPVKDGTEAMVQHVIGELSAINSLVMQYRRDIENAKQRRLQVMRGHQFNLC